MSGAGGLAVLQLLTHHRINSGGAIQAWLLSRELARLGHDVTVAMNERDGTDPATRARIEAIGCRYAGVRLRSLRAIADLRGLLRRGRFDVVHLHREGALLRFLQAAPLCPPIGAVANVGTSKPPGRRHGARFRSRNIDRVVVVAEALKSVLVRSAGVDPGRIDVVYGAYDEERFHPHALPYDRTQQFGVPADARLIGLIANIDRKKGHESFVRAAAKVAAQRQDCWFVCAGKGDREALLCLADQHGLARDRLLALGFHDDIPRLLRTLDLSVSASTHGEGLTGAVRESLAMGTPVISTAVAGNVEIVRHAATGLLVPPGDAEALAAAMLKCLEDPAAARARAERGLAEVRDRLTARRRAEIMTGIYRDIVRWREVRRTPIERILYPQWSDGASGG